MPTDKDSASRSDLLCEAGSEVAAEASVLYPAAEEAVRIPEADLLLYLLASRLVIADLPYSPSPPGNRSRMAVATRKKLLSTSSATIRCFCF